MNERYGKKIMGRGLLSVSAMLVGLLFAMQVQAVCTAGSPNASVVEATPTADFTDNGDGTVTHSLSGLTWDRCSVGQSWNVGTSACDGTATGMPWASALTAAVTANTSNHLFHSGWRLPNQRELLSIVETCGLSPAINRALFPSTPSAFFWSASSFVSNPPFAWFVSFGSGLADVEMKDGNYDVRLVRGGQLLDTFDALAPQLSAVGVSGTTVSHTTLAATSDLAATGYWLVVPQGSAAPTAAEVKAGSDYGAVTVAAAAIGTMGAGTEFLFAVAGLSVATAYDIYLVAYEATNNALSSASKASFTTACLAGSYGTTSCNLASPGYFVPAAGAITQTACPTGRFTAVAGSTVCTDAALGYYVPAPAASAQSACLPGSFSAVAASLACTNAAPGYYVSDPAASAQSACGIGYFSVDMGAAACSPAPQGSYVDFEAATVAASCSPGTSTVASAATSSAACLLDTDLDGDPDSVDTDDDGDGVLDVDDAFPLDAAKSKVASSGGGGAFGLWYLFTLLGATLLRGRRRM